VAIAREKVEKMSGAEKLGLGLAAAATVVGGGMLLRSIMRGWGIARLVDEYAKEPSEDIVKKCVSRVHEVRDLLLDANQKRRAAARGILQSILDRHISAGPFADAKRRFVKDALDETQTIRSAFGMDTVDSIDRKYPTNLWRAASADASSPYYPYNYLSDVEVVEVSRNARAVVSLHGNIRAGPVDRIAVNRDSRELRKHWASEKIPRDAELEDLVETASKSNWVHEQYGHIATWDVREVLSMSGAFEYRAGVPDLTFWDTRKVNSMKNMFRCFRGGVDVSTWDTGSVTTMEGMFASATDFNGDVSQWNTGNVRNMSSMFLNATSFRGTVESWDTKRVEDMSDMFSMATSFDGELKWDTSRVTDMSGMFLGARSFNRDLQWTTDRVTNMSSMFRSATSFNRDLRWTTDRVTNMSSMFHGATRFNRDIGGWNTSRVTDMTDMFYYATAFDQDLSKWDVSKVSKHGDMFNHADQMNNDHKPRFTVPLGAVHFGGAPHRTYV
jgi:surface protein